MKVYYICECCEALVKEVEVSSLGTSDPVDGLTGQECCARIEDTDFNGVFLVTLCDDCRESLQGRSESFYYGLLLN
jgi:hypothetical protein